MNATLFPTSQPRYNMHSKNTMFIPTKMSESVFFIFIFQTQLQDVTLYADRQKKRWVGGKAVASCGKIKKTGSHDWM